jgi:predicted nucleic acid-binding Zn ribbon protein
MSDFKKLGAIINQERDRIWKESPALQLQSLWGDAVGHDIAANTRVKSLRNGVMTVSCSSGTWACELKLSADQLTERVNQLQPPEKVSEIRFIHRARAW